MEDETKTIIEIIKLALTFIAVIGILILAVNNAEEKEYEIIYETKKEVIITDGEDIIKIEKEETEQENEK